ncbi:MAG: DNA polymerase IV [Frankiaceae bacterium]|nr:DNA polymerase IV [Frankiaceae bacterium]MBV9870405.1 DNA polymerase IV [Frankiaceae bacterium]
MSRRQLERDGTPLNLPGDDTGCHVLHADMDAFFASVELRERPELKGQPVIVGGRGGRGVVLAATYEARRFGIHSAMPMSRALRLNPTVTVIEPHHTKYSEASRGVMEIFRSITPIVEPLSLDEAFLDVAGAGRRLGSPRQIAELIRARVADEQGLPCSVGVATTKFIAKLASSRAKPDGLLVVPGQSVTAFLHPLPIGALWGVGEKTEEVLTRLGLRTIGDIAATSESTLVAAVGQAAGSHLHALAWGRDERHVTAHEPDRSIGAEETFGHDVADVAVIRRELLRLSERCAARLRASGQVGRTVSIKIRFADFRTITRSRTLKEPTDVTRVVYDTARSLHEALNADGELLRLVGVRIEGLSSAEETPHQLALAGGEDEWRAAEHAIDLATARFGNGAVRPAALVDKDAGGSAKRNEP